MSHSLPSLEAKVRSCDLCADKFAATHTGHQPRPVVRLSTSAPILVAGQAPGARVHASGLPFDDPSGDRLRAWLDVDREVFYDTTQFAILPMAFCFPGYDAKGSDLPPPPLCAKTWRADLLAAMPQIKLTLLVGGYAQRWHLGARSVTQTVANWRASPSGVLPLPHPSWRNTAWLKKNAWFEAELVPELRAQVRAALEGR